MPIALVTRASRGVGRGVALTLAEAGFTVYPTGRSIDLADLPPAIIRVRCDHTNGGDVDRLFSRLEKRWDFVGPVSKFGLGRL